MTPIGFPSWKEYFSFSLAREYVDENGLFKERVGILERLGTGLSYVVIKPLDLLTTEIRNPLVILSLTLTSLVIVTIAFYPVQSWAIFSRALPFLKSIHVAHVQAALYTLSQMTILGLGLKTLGRLNNSHLMNAYNSGKLQPVPIGAIWI